MISLIIASVLFIAQLQNQTSQPEVKIVTTVESIRGLSRSFVISQNGKFTEKEVEPNYHDSYLFKEKKTRTATIVDSIQYKPLSAIPFANYQNMAANDARITAMINQHLSEGWDLEFVTSAIDGGEEELILTRYYFRRN